MSQIFPKYNHFLSSESEPLIVYIFIFVEITFELQEPQFIFDLIIPLHHAFPYWRSGLHDELHGCGFDFH